MAPSWARQSQPIVCLNLSKAYWFFEPDRDEDRQSETGKATVERWLAQSGGGGIWEAAGQFAVRLSAISQVVRTAAAQFGVPALQSRYAALDT